MQLNKGSDNYIYLNGPVNVSDGSAVSNSPVSCTARIYDMSLEMRTGMLVSRLMKECGSSDTSIVVPKPSVELYRAASLSSVRVYDADGIAYYRVITSVTEPADGYTIGFSGAFGKKIAAGSKVELRSIGSGGTWVPFDEPPLMSEYGQNKTQHATYETLVLGTEDGLQFNQSVEVGFTHLGNPVVDHKRLWAIGTAAPTTIHFGNTRRVRVQIHGDIAMTAFGTFPTSNAIAGDTSWGFRGLLQDIHAGPAATHISVEVTYDGGAGLKLVTAIRAFMENDLT